MYITVKMPREKMKELRQLKARLILAGKIDATDSYTLGRVLDVAVRHLDEISTLKKTSKKKSRLR